MRIGIKLILGFLIVALLVGFVGLFGITSNNTIQKNNQIALEMRELMEELDDLFIDTLLLIETENLDDYQRIKSSFENTRIEFDVLHGKNNEIITNLIGESFNENVDKFTKISNSIIAVHKEKLAEDREFNEKKEIERDLRHKIRTPLFELNDAVLTENVGNMQYKSKEALYQYGDQKHVDEWLSAIEDVKNNPKTLSSILNDLNSYEQISKDLGQIAIEQKMIETDELMKIEQLRVVIDKLEDDEEKIVTQIQTETESLADKTRFTLLIFIIIGFIVSIFLGLYIARSISKPITKLKDAADKIAKGNLAEPVEIKRGNEIGELAESFDNMRYSLKMVMDEYEKMKTGGKGKDAKT